MKNDFVNIIYKYNIYICKCVIVNGLNGPSTLDSLYSKFYSYWLMGLGGIREQTFICYDHYSKIFT